MNGPPCRITRANNGDIIVVPDTEAPKLSAALDLRRFRHNIAKVLTGVQ